jgi:hypothetical protein
MNIGKEGNRCKYGVKSNHSSHWNIVSFEVSIIEGNDAASLGILFATFRDIYFENSCLET